MVLPMLVSCWKVSNTIDGDMVTNVVQHVALVTSQVTDTSHDSYLASLFKCDKFKQHNSIKAMDCGS